MKKQELIDDILAQSYVLKIINTEKVSDTKTVAELEDDTKIYHANIVERIGSVAKGRTVAFYVVNEGEETEQAFYKDKDISDSVDLTMLQRIEPLLLQYHGKVLDSGLNWAHVQANTVEGTALIQANYFVTYDNEALAIKPLI